MSTDNLPSRRTNKIKILYIKLKVTPFVPEANVTNVRCFKLRHLVHLIKHVLYYKTVPHFNDLASHS